MNSNFLIQKFNFNKIFFIIFFSSMISGPLIPELLILALIINYFIKHNFYSLITIHLKLYLILLLIFYIYLNINSLLFSFDVKISLKSTLPYIRLILFSFIVCKLLCDDKDQSLQRNFIHSSLILLFILFIDSLIQLKTGTNIFGNTYKNGRISSFFGSEQIMGSFVIKILPLVFCFLYLFDLNKKKYLRFFFLVITLILIIFSSERVALAHFIFLCSLIFFLDSRSVKNFSVLFLILIFGIIFLLNIYTPAKERITNATLKQIKTSKFLLAPSYRHELHYLTAFYIFLDNPIFGKGIKSFRYECENYESILEEKIINDKAVYAPYDGITITYKIKENFQTKSVLRHFKYNKSLNKIEKNIYRDYEYKDGNIIKSNNKIESNKIIKKGEFLFAQNDYLNGCNTHPHNYFIQFLSETGIVGFLFYLFFFIYISLTVFKTLIIKIKHLNLSNLQKSKCIICGSFFIELIPLLPSGNFFNNWLSMLFYFKIGVLFFLIQNGNNKK